MAVSLNSIAEDKNKPFTNAMPVSEKNVVYVAQAIDDVVRSDL